MNEYDYNGYTITETPDGYYRVGDYEFPTYDEALDWIDSNDEVPDMDTKRRHTFVFYYVDYDLDRCVEEPIVAYSEAEAELKLRREYNVETILDCYVID